MESKNGFLLFTDFHANIWQEFSKPCYDKYLVNTRFSEQIRVLKEIFERAYKDNLIVVFGGDLFDSRIKLDSRVFYSVFRVINSYRTVPVYLLRGNHDSVDNTMESPNSLDPFNYPKINHYVVDTPAQFTEYIGNSPANKVNLSFMPYGENVKEMKDTMKNFADHLDPKAYNIFVGHFGVDGATQGKHSHRLAGAFSVDDLYPDKYDLVYLGHYHKRQNLGGYNHVLYGGSTMPINFNDEGEQKGYDIVTIKDGKLDREFVPVKAKPFVTLTSWTDKDKKIAENAYVRLQLPEKDIKGVSIPESDKSFVRVEPVREYKIESRLDISQEDEDNPVKITDKYLSKYYPDIDLIKEAQEVLTEVDKA